MIFHDERKVGGPLEQMWGEATVHPEARTRRTNGTRSRACAASASENMKRGLSRSCRTRVRDSLQILGITKSRALC